MSKTYMSKEVASAKEAREGSAMKETSTTSALNDIESSLLSSIVFDSELYEKVRMEIKAEDFNNKIHSIIFESISKTSSDIELLIFETIKEADKHKFKIDKEKILQIISKPASYEINNYIEIIKNHSLKRRIWRLNDAVKNKILNPSITPRDILEELQKDIFSLSLLDNASEFKTGECVMHSVIERIKKIKENKDQNISNLRGLDTGFKGLNDITSGFNEGELIIIGAPPGTGKTALILSMALKMIYKKKDVALFSLEMPDDQLLTRILSARTKIHMKRLRNGDLSDYEWDLLVKGLDDENIKNRLFIDDNSYVSISDVRTKLRKLKTKNPNLKAAFIDYLQLMKEENDFKQNKNEMMGEITRGLKILARELKIPIIALAQLNRTHALRENKRPILTDLRDSGSIEQDADIVMFIYRPLFHQERDDKYRYEEELKKNKQNVKDYFRAPPVEKVEIIVAKNRNGEVGTVEVDFNKPLTLFQDLDEDIINDQEDYVRKDRIIEIKNTNNLRQNYQESDEEAPF